MDGGKKMEKVTKLDKEEKGESRRGNSGHREIDRESNRDRERE